MTTFLMFCAVVGGTVMVVQFVLSVIGLTDVGTDIVDDMPDDGDIDISGGHDGHSGADVHHSSTWLFGVLSFRTIIAAMTFFGLTGLACDASGFRPITTLFFATVAGVAAMYGIYGLMRLIYKLGQDGTVQIKRAIGQTGTVYIPIPADRRGSGKIQVVVQQRLMEFAAVTPGRDKLPTGAKVVVTSVVGPGTLEVEPLV